jgi:translation initiation factor 3 subunit A
MSNVLSRGLALQEIYQARVVSHREAEFNRLKKDREDRISRILLSRKLEREKMRKLKYYLKVEEERRQKLREEEEAREREGNHY